MEDFTNSTKQENYQKMLKAIGDAMIYARLSCGYSYEVYESFLDTNIEELKAAENGTLEDFVRIQDISAFYFSLVNTNVSPDYLIKFGKLSRIRNKELLDFLMKK